METRVTWSRVLKRHKKLSTFNNSSAGYQDICVSRFRWGIWGPVSRADPDPSDPTENKELKDKQATHRKCVELQINMKALKLFNISVTIFLSAF